MKLKKVLRFPEILLPLSLLAGLPVVIHKTIDIQLHDTYFVFGGVGWGYFYLAVLFTWNLHFSLRERQLLSGRWRWILVGVTVLSWLAMLLGVIIPSEARLRMGFYLIMHFGSAFSALEFLIYTAPAIVFILSQLIFWIVATIRLISDRGARASE
jgi:hypothetical protein